MKNSTLTRGDFAPDALPERVCKLPVSGCFVVPCTGCRGTVLMPADYRERGDTTLCEMCAQDEYLKPPRPAPEWWHPTDLKRKPPLLENALAVARRNTGLPPVLRGRVPEDSVPVYGRGRYGARCLAWGLHEVGADLWRPRRGTASRRTVDDPDALRANEWVLDAFKNAARCPSPIAMIKLRLRRIISVGGDAAWLAAGIKERLSAAHGIANAVSFGWFTGLDVLVAADTIARLQ